ncbi:YrvL family regulatory protein [uncultured Clostridium sp.]|uniref:YrvL family regulatory protein n=1 Tax=uncultured Clostridium sp. TaxID=59620 RepID=UPI002606DF2E|nr:YrvL family regulatory protein [uncultured Clostridium sp.]
MVNKKMKFKGKSIIKYSGITVMLLIAISIVALICGGIMVIFGFRYNSIWNIILYFIIITIIGFPSEMIIKAFSQVLKETGKIKDNKQIIILFVVLDTLGTMFTMKIVDYLMNSVEASNLAIIVIAFGAAILSIDKDNIN